ncbi:class I SAM-dependent methyltransferase [Tsukamurella soli]|uniref:class I SAM-dependent methyltransferase n=1 Tax=Tsukamurella soli TaxID=644556 RepID=UPI0031EACDEF
MAGERRYDGDSWDIASSVGYTALGVAAARAAESDRGDALAHDPYARLFLAAAGDPRSARRADGDDRGGSVFARTRFIGLRTRFFDDFVTGAAGDGITQVVILAAGLDARAQRLPLPAGTVVYELDQPGVLDFKVRVLAEHDVSPAAGLASVPVDLRDDWPTALRSAGFDQTRPAAWVVEGLLPYLPADAQDLLFARVSAVSAAGSRIAVEAFDTGPDAVAARQRFQAAMARGRGRGFDIAGLVYVDADRADPADTLAAAGWSVAEPREPSGLAQAYGVERVPLPGTGAAGGAPVVRYLTAERV